MASYEKRTWWTRYGLSERLTGDTFLEAAVTSAFLIAAADGNASEQEYDALLDRLEQEVGEASFGIHNHGTELQHPEWGPLDADALLSGGGVIPSIPRDGTLLGALFESLCTLSLRVYDMVVEQVAGKHGGTASADARAPGGGTR